MFHNFRFFFHPQDGQNIAISKFYVEWDVPKEFKNSEIFQPC